MALLAAIAGCAGTAPNGASAPGLPRSTGAEWLGEVCPATVVLQTIWEPEADLGGAYQLVGPGYTVDAEHKRVSGPLVIGGRDTGVRVEVRPGGRPIGFASIPAQMYLDRSITLGMVDGDLAIATSGTHPVIAVVAPLVKSPQILMWDPASHPDWRSVADIGRSGVPVVVSKDKMYPPFLVAKGLVRPEQLDLGYSGSPARFITEPGIVQQGYATQEPYSYEREIEGWRRPVKYQLLADVGHDIYPQALSVRAGDLETLSGCLTRLVPILQRAQIDYLNDPGPANRLIVSLAEAYETGWHYTPGVAEYAARTLRELGLVANDRTGPLGGIDMARVQRTVDELGPPLVRSGARLKPGLTAADVATDRFIDSGARLR